ncbi:uncharacterized protein LOC106667997 isoform X2 [Cimex lectularius]|uniref:Uncharacterized protein n=1 Tax=Cimex lectularius TaxID=79782 RepID=A0A8I6RUW2_CIMLE|nr:uncharacterized protein LOC106667997 isoform X2 [Cimex lectularius]
MNEKQSIYVKEQASQVEENIQKLSSFVNIPSQEHKYKINKKHWDECIQTCLDKYDNHSFDISAHDDLALKRKGSKQDFCAMSKKWDEYTQTCLDKQVKVNSDADAAYNESFTRPETQCDVCNRKNPDQKHLDECVQTCLGTNENQYDILAHSKTETECNVNDKIEKHPDECSQATLDKKESQSKEIAPRPETQCSVCHRNDTITTHLDESVQACFSTNKNQVQAIKAHNEQTVPKSERKCSIFLKSDTNKERFDECIQTCLIANENKIDVVSADNQTIPKLKMQCNVSFKSDSNKNNIDECIQTCLITHENQIFGANNEQTIPQPGTQNIIPNNIFSNKTKLDKFIQISCENEKQPFDIVAHSEQDITGLNISNKYDINKDHLDKCVQICFDPNINISSLNNTENKSLGTQLNNSSNCNNDMLPKSVYTLANLKQFELPTPIKKLIKQNEIKSVLNFQTRSDERASIQFIEHINHDQKLSSRCGGDTKTRNNEITDKSSTPESSHSEENSISEKSPEQKSNDDFISNQHASIDFNNEKNYGKDGNISPSNIGTSENIVLANSDELLIPQKLQHLQGCSSESDSIVQDFYMNLTDLGIGPDWKLLKDETMQKSLVLLSAKRISMKKSFSSLREKIRDEVDWFVKEKMLNNTIK